ncbi:hypothetical protein C8R44DRAFT_753883 [Mycena epipterygia]|nr:hypothetical protein C8R44DRAFT_753883 [Mycena epipterygia]
MPKYRHTAGKRETGRKHRALRRATAKKISNKVGAYTTARMKEGERLVGLCSAPKARTNGSNRKQGTKPKTRTRAASAPRPNAGEPVVRLEMGALPRGERKENKPNVRKCSVYARVKDEEKGRGSCNERCAREPRDTCKRSYNASACALGNANAAGTQNASGSGVEPSRRRGQEGDERRHKGREKTRKEQKRDRKQGNEGRRKRGRKDEKEGA